MDSATLMRYLAIAQTLPGILKILVILVLFGAFVGVSYLILQSPPLKPNNVSFQRVTTFLVMVEPNAYQVGIVAKVFNSDTSSRLISGATIEPLTFQFSGGNGYIKKFFITEGKSTNEEDVAIKPNDFGEVKLLLPIKWIAEIQIPLNFIFLSSFTIHFKDGVADLSDVKADRYGNFDRFISPDEWSRLLKPSSTINLDVVSYKTTPASANTPGQ